MSKQARQKRRGNCKVFQGILCYARIYGTIEWPEPCVPTRTRTIEKRVGIGMIRPILRPIAQGFFAGVVILGMMPDNALARLAVLALALFGLWYTEPKRGKVRI
jgi:hypothetical protein